MATYELLESILTNGIRNTHYFNGRVLSAEDLQNDQDAIRRREEHYGLALGDGVVHGLLVSESPDSTAANPLLQITPGLAINRKGQALHLDLPEPLTLRLIAQQAQEETEAGLFAPCRELETKTFLTNPGFYLLTISPVSGFEGRVPQYEDSAFGVTNINCISKYAVEGLQFRLVKLDLDVINNTGQFENSIRAINDLGTISSGMPDKMSKLRNILAHVCFGSEQLPAFYEDFFIRTDAGLYAFQEYGAFPKLRERELLADCDVPLALIYWSDSGIQFIDMWAARRMLVPDGSLFSYGSAVIYAAIEQFQAQLAGLENLEEIAAADYFHFLPPVGKIPLSAFYGGEEVSSGIVLDTFFQNKWRNAPGDISCLETRDTLSFLRTGIDYRPQIYNDIRDKSIRIFSLKENCESLSERVESQAYIYFSLPDLAKRFHASTAGKATALYSDRRQFVPLLAFTLKGVEYKNGRNAEISVGLGPIGIAFDGTHIWVANSASDNVSKIDVMSNTVVATVSDVNALRPTAIAFDGTHIWVANEDSDNVSKIDVASNTVVATVSDVDADKPTAIAFDGTHIWVANYDSDNVSKIDVTSNTVVDTVNVNRKPNAMAFDGSHLWVTNSFSNNVSKIDVTSNIVVATHNSGGSLPTAIAFDGSHVWVANLSGEVVHWDVHSIGSFIHTTFVLNARAMAFDGSHIWLTANTSVMGTINKIDVTGNTVNTFLLFGTVGPLFIEGIAFDGSHIWVTGGSVFKILT